MRVVVIALVLTISSPALAQRIAGPASVVDGDSLSVSGLSVRLFGIDAPEGKQTCTREGQKWACGEEAANQLRELVAGARVDCFGRGMDDFGRMLAVCSAGYVELNKTMVGQGWALAFRKYSEDYVAEEAQARTARLGIWASEFEPPESYRAAQSPAPREQPRVITRTPTLRAVPRSDCHIKGNHSRKGEWIYHLPGMPYYEQTRPEAMFCSEAEAQAAGYRRSRARR